MKLKISLILLVVILYSFRNNKKTNISLVELLDSNAKYGIIILQGNRSCHNCFIELNNYFSKNSNIIKKNRIQLYALGNNGDNIFNRKMFENDYKQMVKDSNLNIKYIFRTPMDTIIPFSDTMLAPALFLFSKNKTKYLDYKKLFPNNFLNEKKVTQEIKSIISQDKKS